MLSKNPFSTVMHYSGLQPIKSILAVGVTDTELSLCKKTFPSAILKSTSVLPVLSDGTYDLIILSMQDGNRISSELSATLAVHLKENGFLLVSPSAAAVLPFDERCTVLRVFDAGERSFVLFSKSIGPRVMEDGYLPAKEWPEVHSFVGVPKLFDPSFIGKGYYWRLWPFSFEKYHGDIAPVIVPLPPEKKMPVRIIMWQRHVRSETPRGWHTPSEQPAYKVGFVPLAEKYHTHWSENARRNRRKWLDAYAGIHYRIEEVPFEEFKKAYLKSTLPLTLRGPMISEIEIRLQNPKLSVTFYGVRRIQDGKLVAGLASLNSSTLPVAYYLSGFYLKEVAHDPVMVGLFDHWFHSSLTSRVRFIDFGNFWKPGDDEEWKGFSLFKAKFNPLYFFFPPLLFQFRIGKRR